MRKLLLTLCLLFVAVPMWAAGTRATKLLKMKKVVPAESIRVRDADPVMVANVLKEFQQSLAAARKGQNALKRLRPSPDAITEIRAARAFIIPVAGNAAGGGGTFFRSDITLENNNDVEQDVLSVWIASGVTTTTPPSKLITLPEDSVETIFDYVGTVQQQTGLGAIFFIPVFQGGVDEDAAVDGFSRIWTPQPGSTGTVSQPFDGVDPESFLTLEAAGALGLRAGDGFRTNWFIVNASNTPITFDVVFFGEFRQDERTVTVPASSLLFQQIPTGDRYGALAMYFLPDDANLAWVGGGSSTDNATGDGWVTLASAVYTDNELDALEK